MTWAVKQKVGNATGKAILLMLANYSDHEGKCFPGQKTLSDECECSLRAVNTWLQMFERTGLIRREKRWRKDGYRSSDTIILSLEISRANAAHKQDISHAPCSDLTCTRCTASILNLSEEPKGKKMVWKVKVEDGPLLNRTHDEDVWKACESIMKQRVPSYMENARFPSDIVQMAKEALK